MTFYFSEQSQANLANVHGDLQKVMNRAITIALVDFSITEGGRAFERQQALVHSGASNTLDSRHLLKHPGNDKCLPKVSHAVDTAAWVAGTRYDFGLMLLIAKAVQAAAIELKIPVVWGATWQPLNETTDLVAAIGTYVMGKYESGETPFVDSPHFHLSRREYPT